jgi:hypothetical protein
LSDTWLDDYWYECKVWPNWSCMLHVIRCWCHVVSAVLARMWKFCTCTETLIFVGVVYLFIWIHIIYTDIDWYRIILLVITTFTEVEFHEMSNKYCASTRQCCTHNILSMKTGQIGCF